MRGFWLMAVLVLAGCKSDADRLVQLEAEKSMAYLSVLRWQSEFDSLSAASAARDSATDARGLPRNYSDSVHVAAKHALDELRRAEAEMAVVERDIRKVSGY